MLIEKSRKKRVLFLMSFYRKEKLKVLEVNVHVQGVHATTSKEEPEVLPEANNNEQ